jgi:acyl-[acyl-carrier-protein]-phospholipid O-acyltransferase/long-chain-fatty-acid--[acyl-carrier-protein] ligase
MRDLLAAAVLKAAAGIFRLIYRVEVHARENMPGPDVRTVVVCNHVAALDGPLLAAFLPGRPVFAVNTFYAAKWWVRSLLIFVEALRIDPTSPMATKSLIRAVRSGRTCVIFPEGRLTVTGALMKVYEGPGMIAEKAGAVIVPVRIDGAQYTHFSRLKGKVRRRLFPKITITLLEPCVFKVPPGLSGRQRRRTVGTQLYDVMSNMIFETSNRRQTLFDELLDRRALVGGKAAAIEDIERNPISYDKLVRGCHVLGRKLSQQTEPRETVGLLLPNAAATVVAFFALQAFGRVPAMLNFTSGTANLRAACTAARVRLVLSSRVFVDRARLANVVAGLGEQVQIVFLEDLKQRIGLADKLYGLAAPPLTRLRRWRVAMDPQEPAVILFTSGTEGTPKGVVLSHENILSNCYQLAARVDFSPADVAFNALPLFHAFGLVGGMILPLISGVQCFMYPSPLHYRIIPELVYGSNATVLFGTDTFLAGYARLADPYDFYAVRYVFAGAEKVRDETRAIWMDRFGLRILEGYGVTECSPVIAVNTPMHYRAGTVGRLLPGIAHRVESVPGIEDGGRLFVSGPNVMLGYLGADRPGELRPPPSGWHDTGDIVGLDEDGYVHVLGRARRFAKIAGEMISLGAVEKLAQDLWPEGHHAAVALPERHKGEQIILVTDDAKADREELLSHAHESGLPEIMVPKVLLCVGGLPVLGSGKTDYVKTQALAETLSYQAKQESR